MEYAEVFLPLNHPKTSDDTTRAVESKGTIVLGKMPCQRVPVALRNIASEGRMSSNSTTIAAKTVSTDI